MTIERDAEAAQLFGLAGTFPRPGWVVLDAARDHQFTGEVVFETLPEVRVYLDRGRIYLAERVTDPSLGSRLVDAGALNAAQLEHGSMRIGDAEHLGRLFERVPSVDRHAVLVTAELMTEECVGWLAGQSVRSATSTPYRHHPSGVHRWDRPAEWSDLSPGDPLPAPAADEAPVEIAPPEPLFATPSPIDPFDDDMIRWDEPSWLDPHGTTAPPALPTEPAAPAPTEPAPTEPTAPASPEPAPTGDALDVSSDWIDRLEHDGLPDRIADPLSSPASLPRAVIESADRFEVIWPSGEVDEQFGATDAAASDRHPDHDRAGPTARLARNGRSTATVDAAPPEQLAEPATVAPEVETVDDELTDDVVLAVRRAVASIETGSLAARRRLVESPDFHDTSRGTELVPPGRVAVRDEPAEWSGSEPLPSRLGLRTPTRSVFDEVPAEPEPETESEPVVEAAPVTEATEARTGALRRLIGSLRRR